MRRTRRDTLRLLGSCGRTVQCEQPMKNWVVCYLGNAISEILHGQGTGKAKGLRGRRGLCAQKADIPIIAQGMFRHVNAHMSEFLPHPEAFPEAERLRALLAVKEDDSHKEGS